MKDKIALEEHLSTPLNNSLWDSAGEASRNGKAYMEDVEKRLLDVDLLLETMDHSGIDVAVMSLTSPGTQALLDPAEACDFAVRSNDWMAEKVVSRAPKRLRQFATVALQSPRRAADELERAVKSLGAKGAMINGYTNIGSVDCAQYMDEKPVWEFWDRVAALDVPVYLHPREPLPSQCRIYDGYPSLVGSAMGFGQDAAAHAVRLILSGLFDRYPNLIVILGHLGEGLPFLLPRIEHRLIKQSEGIGMGGLKLRPCEYLSRNFYLTTSGHFNTRPLFNTISQVGVERVLFSVDYPYESMEQGGQWFDNTVISENDRRMIGRTNAQRLLRL